MKRLTVTIYEGGSPAPVLTHIAYGETDQEADAIIRVHAQYDQFLAAALLRTVIVRT